MLFLQPLKQLRLFNNYHQIKTVIGFGSKNERDCQSSGAPLGSEDWAATKANKLELPAFTVLLKKQLNFHAKIQKARGAKANEA